MEGQSHLVDPNNALHKMSKVACNIKHVDKMLKEITKHKD